MSSFTAQHSLFRAYDIRGDEQYFTPIFLQALGEAFVRLYKNFESVKVHDSCADSTITVPITPQTPTLIIGYDVRYGSDDIAQTLALLIQQQGLQVINLGLVTTPMMVFWTEKYDGHGIMVTASHSAKGILGIKWLVGDASPTAEDIHDFYNSLILADSIKNSTDNVVILNPDIDDNAVAHMTTNIGSFASTLISVIDLPTDAVAAPYIEAIADVFSTLYPYQNPPVSHNQTIKKLDLTIVIDCMHGATSRIVLPLFTRFCQRVIIINDTPDGDFPMGNPDPTEPNRLTELQQSVRINEADIGLAFDGDGDRLMIVDNHGKVVAPDHLLYLLAQVALTERSQAVLNKMAQPQVLFDIKCSHHLIPLLTQLGATPVMSRTGSSLMRQQLQSKDSQIIFAGELSGHFIFNDGYFTAYDDAMYAGLRLLHWLAYNANADKNILPSAYNFWRDKKDLSQSHQYQLTDIINQLPPLVSTADHYLPLPNTADSDCSIVQQLATFCQYLHEIIKSSLLSKGSVSYDSLSNIIPSNGQLPDEFDNPKGDDHEYNTNECDNHLKTVASLSLRNHCNCLANKQRVTLAQAKQLLPIGTRLSCIDGVRLDFSHGFGLLRQSNTSHNLTVRFAGDSTKDMQAAQAQFVALCLLFDKDLAEQIAVIQAE